MRYVYSAMIVTLAMIVTFSSSTACEMRKVIRTEITDRFTNIEIDIDTDGIEERVHEMVHKQLDRAKSSLERERDRLRDERRRVERERRRVEHERSQASHDDHDDDGAGWGKSVLLALGLYGVGLFLLTRRSRRRNTE